MPVVSTTGEPPPPPRPPPPHLPTARQDWQFILGPASGGWLTPLAQATGRTITWRLTDAHDASFTVNATAGLDAGIVPLATDLHVLYAGEPVFRGRIGNTSDQLSGGTHLATFTATSYKGLLNRRQIYSTSQLVWTNTDIGDVVWGLLQQTQQAPGGGLGIVRGTGFPFGATASKTVQPGDLIGEKIDDLAYVDIGGFDWDIQPSDQTQHTIDLWAAGHGQDRGVVLQYGDALTSSDWQRDVDTSGFADAIRMTGGTPTGTGVSPTPAEVVAADIATRLDGRWDASFQTDELDESRLIARADLQLAGAGMLVPSYVIPLQPGAWRGPSHIWVGDTIHISLNSGRFTGTGETMRVLELAADVGQDATQVTITAGQPRLDQRRQLQRLAREIRRARKNRSSGKNLRPGYHFISA